MPSKGPKPSTASFEDGDEPWRCRAKSKQKSAAAGEPVRCGNQKAPGYNVCRYHGAGGGRPITHGRYSERMGRFREAYQNALEDKEGLMDLTETMAVLDIAVHRAAERADQADTPEFRAEARRLFERAREATDPEQARRFLTELGRHLDRGGEEDAALDRLATAAERLANRQEKAWGIRLSAAQAINARDLMAVLARFVDIVVEEAPSSATRIVERVDREIVGGGEVSPRLSAGDE